MVRQALRSVAVVPFAVTLSLALAAVLPACKKQSGPIRIGIVNSVTGPEAPIGELLTNGYLLARKTSRRLASSWPSSPRTTPASRRWR